LLFINTVAALLSSINADGEDIGRRGRNRGFEAKEEPLVSGWTGGGIPPAKGGMGRKSKKLKNHNQGQI